MSAFTFHRRADGVAVLRHREGIRVTRAITEAAVACVRTEMAAEPAPLLVDLRAVTDATIDSALVGPAQDEGRVALLVDNFLLQLLSREFMKHNDDRVSRRVFRDEELALQWLLSAECASPSSPSSVSSTSRSTRSA